MPKQQDHRSKKPNDPAATGKLNPHPPRPRDPKDIPVRQNFQLYQIPNSQEGEPTRWTATYNTPVWDSFIRHKGMHYDLLQKK